MSNRNHVSQSVSQSGNSWNQHSTPFVENSGETGRNVSLLVSVSVVC